MSAPEIRIVERVPPPSGALPRAALASLPAACALLLLAFRGGAWALPVAATLVLACALLAPALWKGELGSLGALDVAALAAFAVYTLSGLLGVYPGAAVPALAHAALAYVVFRAAAQGEPESQARALVAVAAVAAAIGIAGSLFQGGPARAVAAWPLVNHDHLATVCAIALPLAIVRAKAGLDLFLAGVIGVALAFTLSRAGIASALVPAVVALALVARRRAVPALAAIAAAAVLLAITTGPLVAKLEAGRVAVSFAERLSLWRAAWNAFLARPVLGWGAGGFANVFPQWRTPEVPYRVDHAHQEPLEIAVEAGVLGIAAFGVFLFLAARVAIRKDSLARAAALGALAALLHGFADFPTRIPAVAVIAAWALGIALSGPREKAVPRLALLAPLAIAVLACFHAAGAMLAPSGLATRLAPWNAGLWREAGDAARDRGLATGEPALLEHARALYSEALERNPRDPHALVARARLALLAGETEPAFADLEAAVATDPAPPAWQLARIDALADARPDDAIEAAHALSRTRADLHSRVLELLLAKLGEDPRILEAATADVPEAHARAASVLLERGFVHEARAHADRAADLSPATYAELAASLAEQDGDPAAAFARIRTHAERLGCGTPSPKAESPRLALLASRLAPPDAAVEYARCAVAIAPEHAGAWMRVAELTADRAAWEKAADLARDDPAPLIGLARLEEKAGNLDAALAAARAAESRRTCGGAGALELARLLDANGMRAAAVLRLEELKERCPASEAIARRHSELASRP